VGVLGLVLVGLGAGWASEVEAQPPAVDRAEAGPSTVGSEPTVDAPPNLGDAALDDAATDDGATDDAATDDGATAGDAPSGDASTDTEAPAPGPSPTPRRRLVVVEIATFGIDPVVGRIAGDRVRRTASAMGYDLVDDPTWVAAAQRLRMTYPPTPADLWRLTWATRSQRGLFARIHAAGGLYVIDVTVASLDGTGPFFAHDTATSDALREVLDRLVAQALPTPATWQEQAPPVPLPSATATGPFRLLPSGPAQFRERPRLDLAHPAAIGVRLPQPPLRRWQVTLQTEGSFGTTQGFFYNHMIGARLDFRITRDLMIGAYVGYANLDGRNGRADNILLLLQGEQRIRLSPALDLSVPLRVAAGYLPFNGPVIRLAAGLNYAFSQDLEVGLDLVAPTFWILPDSVSVSLDVAAEVTYRLP